MAESVNYGLGIFKYGILTLTRNELRRIWAVGGVGIMANRRPARTRTEIDFLPPFGEPEVVTTGNRAFDVAIAGVAVAGTAAYLLNS